MKRLMFSVFDRAATTFGQPIFAVSRGVAVRSFTDEVNRSDSQLNQHADDYDLYEVGSFEDDSAVVSAKEPIELVVRGKDVLVDRK